MKRIEDQLAMRMGSRSAPMDAAVVAPLFPIDGPTPPVGTPTAEGHGGNSAPARTPVVGRQKSEQVGEQTGCSLPVTVLLGGVHHG